MTSPLLAGTPSFAQTINDFKNGRTTPRDYLERCIDAVERLDPTIKAFVRTDFDRARKLADASTKRYKKAAPLSSIDGMPIGIKDIVDVAGLPTQMNNGLYKDYYPRTDAACVRAIYEGGGIPMGKVVTTEFAIGRSGDTVNPHNPHHTPGGSSSGSAAGVAAGMFPAALGTQTQGSVIRPASFCGVVGYKPTHSRLSLGGTHPVSASHDHLGVLAMSVDDAWWLARCIAEYAPVPGTAGLRGAAEGPTPALPLTRALVLRTQGYEDMDEASLAAFEDTLDKLRARGVTIVESSSTPQLTDLTSMLDKVPPKSLEMVAFDMRWPYMSYVEDHPELMGPRLHSLMEDARNITRGRYQELLQFRQELAQRLANLHDEFDVFLLPASSGPAPEGFEFTGARTLLVYSSFLGLPAYSLPVMNVSTLPMGLQVMGYADGDYRLTRHAQWLMQALQQ